MHEVIHFLFEYGLFGQILCQRELPNQNWAALVTHNREKVTCRDCLDILAQ